jgi:hypothetical protein
MKVVQSMSEDGRGGLVLSTKKVPCVKDYDALATALQRCEAEGDEKEAENVRNHMNKMVGPSERMSLQRIMEPIVHDRSGISGAVNIRPQVFLIIGKTNTSATSVSNTPRPAICLIRIGFLSFLLEHATNEKSM